jgi:hypothetical protein
MPPRHTILVACFLVIMPSLLLGSAGPLVEVTRKTRPQFISVTAARANEGVTRFDIVLAKDGEFVPNSAFIELRDNGQLKLLAALVIYRDPGKDEWRIVVHAGEDTIRRGKIRIGYGLPPGFPSVSRNWSISLTEFAEEEKPATRPATRPAA